MNEDQNIPEDIPEGLAAIEREFVEQVREELGAMLNRLEEIQMLYLAGEEAA